MEIIGREPDKYNVSAGQRKVTEFLSSLGLVVDSEKTIGSYRVDIFLPELNFVVEVDGPFMHHSERHETLRDTTLRALGVAEVIHVTGLGKEDFKELARKVGYEGNVDT